MLRFSLFPIFVAATVIAVIAHDRVGSKAADIVVGHDLYSQKIDQADILIADITDSADSQAQLDEQAPRALDVEFILDIEAYEDADYGFSVAIPSGWTKIIAAEAEGDFSILEPGYAIGFESPYQGEHDKFADYVLIEVLPGNDSGLFESDGKNGRMISIDGQAVWMDRLDIKGVSGGLTEVDLTIFQTELSGLGYTVGLYAIGEPSREKLMSDAFEVIVRTFRQTSSPFPTS